MPGRRPPEVGVSPTPDDLPEPFEQSDVKRRVQDHLENEQFYPSKHAKERLVDNRMSLVDVVNVLRGGSLNHERWLTHEGNTWRYRFETRTMAAVVAFDRDRGNMVLVSAFRLGG